MKVGKIFLIIGALVLAFLIWGLFFNTGGVLQTGWNSMAKSVNKTWDTVTGDSSAKILPSFGDASVDTEGQNLGNTDSGF
jgi:hypothetical protein